VFKLLKANTAKITRMPGDFHRLDSRKTTLISWFARPCCTRRQHCAGAPRGQARAQTGRTVRGLARACLAAGQGQIACEDSGPLVATGFNERFYTVSDYREFFKQAALPLSVKRVNLSTGFRYYVDELFNGFTHARYAFIGTSARRVNSAWVLCIRALTLGSWPPWPFPALRRAPDVSSARQQLLDEWRFLTSASAPLPRVLSRGTKSGLCFHPGG